MSFNPAARILRNVVRQRVGRLSRVGLLLVLLLPGLSHADSAVTNTTRIAQSRLSVGGIVVGILGYTRWPQAAAGLQVCVSGNSADALDVAYQLQRAQDPRKPAVRSVEPGTVPPDGCDVIYFEGWSRASQSAVLSAVAHQPVLTIGQGPEFCSDGGMFCLEPGADGTRFEVNLDALARSGLHVHPQVLRMGRPRGGRPS